VRHLIKEATESYAIGVVDIFPLDDYPVGHKLPFGCLWYTLPPNSTSKEDSHVSVEMSIVVSGTAWVEASGEITEVGAGGIFLLDSWEGHIIHNRSADQPLMVFTTYWQSLDGSAGSAAGPQEAVAEARPQS
jgi:mannose-6-phosphate isomerase-like protein (cupin superfamily)